MDTRDAWILFLVALMATIVAFEWTEGPIEEFEKDVDDAYGSVLAADTPEEFKVAVEDLIIGDSNHGHMLSENYPILLQLSDGVNETNLEGSKGAVAALFEKNSWTSGWWCVRFIMVGIMLALLVNAIWRLYD